MSNVIEVSGSPIERKDRPSQALVHSGDVTPMHMLAVAVQQGADLAKLEKLMELQERWEKNQARKAYVAAMAAFKANPPTILKNKHVSFELKTGGRTEYNHATHDEVTTKVIVALAPHGLSHNWTMRQENNLIYVKCTITHELGYSESTELYGSPDTTGTKSAIQAVASTVTLLQRYTLLAVTGLTSEEMGKADTDGRTQKPKLTVEQIANLEALITEVGSNKINFLKWARVETLEDILASNYTACVQALEQKRKA
jgi:hypothetical protein